MNPESEEYLKTILEEGAAIQDFVRGLDFDSYRHDKKTRFAVERGFEIIGEALTRLRRVEPALLERIKDHRTIISFRNILAHAYDHIEDKIVWGIIESNLDPFLNDIDRLLGDKH